VKASFVTEGIRFEVEGRTAKELFELVSSLESTFYREPCAACGSTNVMRITRRVDSYTFHNLKCVDCGSMLELTSTAADDHTLFPRRKNYDTGESLGVRGWVPPEGRKRSEQEPEPEPEPKPEPRSQEMQRIAPEAPSSQPQTTTKTMRLDDEHVKDYFRRHFSPAILREAREAYGMSVLLQAGRILILRKKGVKPTKEDLTAALQEAEAEAPTDNEDPFSDA